MAEAVESRPETMQAGIGEIEAFRYAESPWVEEVFEIGNSQPVTFPETVEADPGASPRLDGAGARNRETSRQVVTERYSYGVEYSAGPGFPCDEAIADAEAASAEPPENPAREMERQQLFQQLLASESQKAEEHGHGKGMEMGLALGREEAQRQLQGERERLLAQGAALLESFSAAQEKSLHQLEQEAVKLALAIAARILRREAHTDPLLLTGSVRVALGQLAASTAVRLLVPAQDQPMWEEAMARIPGLPIRPQVIGDSRMALGDCRMETELGSADLGLWPQLKAIERGFFSRPGSQDPERNQPSSNRFAEDQGHGD